MSKMNLPDALVDLVPHPDEVDIEKIAHCLAHQCRFNGETKEFYSVASHSSNLVEYILDEMGDRELALYALVHDVAEAYTGDIISPIKECFPKLMEFEEVVLHAILDKLDIPYPIPAKVYELDKRIVEDEWFCLGHAERQMGTGLEPLGIVVLSEPPNFAQFRFLRHFWDLY